MVISYDNLIVRLWMNGAVMPFADLTGDVETLIDDKGLPPIPHPYWVDRLGFQQPDPVTDFRSGGVLSLAMMVHMVESCTSTVKRFHEGGDAQVLPFGITSINVTDMVAKFLMLAKSTDRMEALMSQKPFWRMFADPNAILAVQEIAMNMMCDVVVELKREKKLPKRITGGGGNKGEEEATSMQPEHSEEVRLKLMTVAVIEPIKQTTRRRMVGTLLYCFSLDTRFLFVVHTRFDSLSLSLSYYPFLQVTVFDFPQILEKTERRVRDDLLGAGPSTVEELRSIAGRLRLKYASQIEAKEKRAEQPLPREQLRQATGQAVSNATTAAAGMLERIKSTKIATPNFAAAASNFTPPSFGLRRGNDNEKTTNAAADDDDDKTKSAANDASAGDQVLLPTEPSKEEVAAKTQTIEEALFGTDGTDTTGGDDGLLIDTNPDDILNAVTNFSIGDDDEDEEMDLDKLLNS